MNIEGNTAIRSFRRTDTHMHLYILACIRREICHLCRLNRRTTKVLCLKENASSSNGISESSSNGKRERSLNENAKVLQMETLPKKHSA